MKEITQTQKLLDTINMHGPIRTGKLEELTKVPAKNHSGLLAGRIAMGHVIVAKVQENIKGRMRSVTEYKIGAAYTSKAAERVAQIDYAKKKAPAPFRRDEVPAVREAQPAVADNTGSASLVVHSSQGGAQSIQDEATVKDSLQVESALSVQEGGNHYKSMRIQPIEYIHANSIPFPEGSIIKYVSRWRSKNGIADLKKARHFIDLLIELETRVEK